MDFDRAILNTFNGLLEVSVEREPSWWPPIRHMWPCHEIHGGAEGMGH
jgi:hypothetical protein